MTHLLLSHCYTQHDMDFIPKARQLVEHAFEHRRPLTFCKPKLLQRLRQKCSQSPFGPQLCDILFNEIQKFLQQSPRTIMEIKAAISLVRKVLDPVCQAHHQSSRHLLYERLWSVLETSQVTKLPSLPISTYLNLATSTLGSGMGHQTEDLFVKQFKSMISSKSEEELMTMFSDQPCFERLRVLTDALLAMQRLDNQEHTPHPERNALSTMLDCMPPALAKLWALKTAARLRTRATTTSTMFRSSGYPAVASTADLWLVALRSCRHMDEMTWARVYNKVSMNVSPADLARHFSGLSWQEIPTIIFKHWVVRHFCSTDALLAPGFEHALRDVVHKMRGDPRDPRYIGMDIVSFLRQTEEYVLKTPMSRFARAATILKILRRLEGGIRLAESFVSYVLELLLRLGDLEFARFAYFAARVEHVYLPASLVKRFVNATHLKEPYLGRRLFPYTEQGLIHFPNFIERLILAPEVDRATIHDFVSLDDGRAGRLEEPQSARERPHKVQLVHRMATWFAEAPHLHAGQKANSIYQLYHYMKSQQMPIGPEISQAMVHATVFKPIDVGHQVSTAFYHCALRMILNIEGRSAADQFHWKMQVTQREAAVPAISPGFWNAQVVERNPNFDWTTRCGCGVCEMFSMDCVL